MKLDMKMLDDDMEVIGRRLVSPSDKVCDGKYTNTVYALNIELSEPMSHIERVEIQWFSKDEKSVEVNAYGHHLSVILKLHEVPYYPAWGKFKNVGVRTLLQALDMQTYVFGNGFSTPFEEDVFLIEMHGFEGAEWLLNFRIGVDWTYTDCLEIVHQIEHCAREFLVPLLSE